MHADECLREPELICENELNAVNARRVREKREEGGGYTEKQAGDTWDMR